MKLALAGVFVTATTTVALANDPPPVSSGTLVANFASDISTMDFVEGTNEVSAWRAKNNSGIALAGVGATTSNIIFDPTEVNGKGAVVVNDYSGQNRHLEGDLGGVSLTAATIFWHGYYSPGRDGSLSDSSGQYIYSLGADGANGTQLDAQCDDGFFEIYGGDSTQRGIDITDWHGQYSIWTTKFYAGPTKVGHDAWVNDVHLGVPVTSDGYALADDNLVLFAYQNSGGSGSSGYNFVGNVHQVLIYDGALDETDTQAIKDYLACKMIDCPYDLTGDCLIAGDDLTYILSAWGTDDADADLDGSGIVDGVDLAHILGEWGACTE